MKSAWLKLLTMLMLASIYAVGAGTRQWAVLGPDGGDVRSLAYDPHDPNRVFLGTSTGVIFVSEDAGHNWSRFAKLGSGDDYVLDHIAIDPHNSKTIFVSAWSVQDQSAGDIFRTRNGGKDWEPLPAMHGKSVRAMALSASDPKVVVAGALDGVYRSRDAGNHWEHISEAGIKNIESIAVDPKDPNVIYAGTWHLAWKTGDGGSSWQHINKGMIDDSDVFSIIVSSANSSEVFASACSGIYKSTSAGDQFQKIQGIPFTARRTRVLKQDPSNPAVVYAGTTEGLWKSVDEGKTWKRMSNPEVVVNDVLIDPRNSQRVLLATDRSGVLASDDSAATFSTSNHGYTHRYVSAILSDSKEPDTLYIGVVNDREFGGVFSTHDGGQTWQQKSSGLDGRDVFALKEAANGTLVAGTNRGMFELEKGGAAWHPINNVVLEKTVSRTVKLKSGKTKTVTSTSSATRSVLDGRVSDADLTSSRWFAATSAGLFTSKDQGKVWMGGPIAGEKDFVSVQAHESLVVAATRSSVLVSQNAGSAWQPAVLASYPINVRSVTVAPDGQIFVATREGAFHSADSGHSWNHVVAGLPDKDITSVTYDGSHKRLIATSGQTGVVFESADGGSTWLRGPDSGFPLRRISVVHGRYVGATPFDGVIAQPENEAQSANAGGSK
jgi:photosystem II stability/assembly factor-like uncharacterized protein